MVAKRKKEMPQERRKEKLIVVKPDAIETRYFRHSWAKFEDHVRRNYSGAMFFAASGAAQVAMRNRCFGIDDTNIRPGFQPWENEPFIKNGFEWDYCVMVDTDMVFEGWMIDRMIASGRPVIGAAGVKEDLGSLAAGIYIDEATGEHRVLQPEDIEGKDIIESVPYVGFGLMVIQRDVFRIVPAPWFDHVTFKNINGVPRQIGVDLSFCWRVQQYGFKVALDCVSTASLGHEKPQVLRLKDLIRAQKERRDEEHINE